MLRRIDASFVSKAVYGLVNVMVLLLVMEDHPPDPFAAAVTLFGATVAIALVELYAELVGETIGNQRALTREELLHIRDTVTPVLIGAQVPTIILLLSALGLFPIETALGIDQIVVFVLLAGYGIRAIAVQQKHPLKRLFGACLLLVLGALIVWFKYAFH